MGSLAAAAAVAAKTARACDICVRKRARWYCTADDAFLCQSCDDSVHSANPLARRHERLRLNTASSLKRATDELPQWHRGPTKKPRTPRHRKKKQQQQQQQHPVVPELDTCSASMEEDEEEQLLYRVPVFDDQYDDHHPVMDFDVAEFAADVEALLGKGLDGDHSCGIEELGFLFKSESDERREDGIKEEVELGLEEPFELTFDYDDFSVETAYPIDDIKVVPESVRWGGGEERKDGKMLLRLDYDAISRAWGSHGLPWIHGGRPNLDSWPLPITTEGCGVEVDTCGASTMIRGGDGAREARVSRYREKRRTRLFSNKIRYEVRKLNAEKRPRMKGRFVKRSSFPLLTK